MSSLEKDADPPATQVAELEAELAEARRDFRIEASVERIRSRALAMRRSDELVQVADLMKSEMEALGARGITACTIYTRRADGGHRA